MGDKTFTQNREVTWLRFNERVMEEAMTDEVPLLEKTKFISIFTSNLDEFFMVRVGSLHDLTLLKKDVIDNKTGMTAQEQIDTIMDMLPAMYEKKDRLYRDVTERLAAYDIRALKYEALNKEQLTYVENFYRKNIWELVSPQIIDAGHPFPFLENKKLYIIVRLVRDDRKLFGLVPIRRSYPRYVMLPGDKTDYILIEEILYHQLDKIFKGFKIVDKYIITVTRNFDMSDDKDIKDEFDDYKEYMKAVLKKRKRLYAVRLESNEKLPKPVLSFLLDKLKLKRDHYFVSEAPLTMDYVFGIMDKFPSSVRERLTYAPFQSYNPFADSDKPVIEQVREKDFMLSYPFDDIDGFVDLLKEAAEDPECLSIKITIYRLAKNSNVVKYLCRAAENGKEVTVFVELKARFDEENNINYSNILYEAGCNIIYGFNEYKTHSKLFLITFKRADGTYSYITQIGTGNYNESTSRLYTDFSLITADRGLGLDANDFFKNMSIGNLNGKYEHLLQAPTGLKQHFMRLLDREIAKGKDGFVFCKFNSLTDKDFLEKFRTASRAGVTLRFIIRGICCILPGVKGQTDNIEIHGIVGRFLEHSRVYVFGSGRDCDMYISSADLMTRNTERRVEIAAPIYDPAIKERLFDYLRIQFKDNMKGRRMTETGMYERIEVPEGERPFSAQDYFLEEAKEKNYLQRTRRNEKAVTEKKTGTEKSGRWKRFTGIFKRRK